jgi:PAS domain S-box-containing protein
MSTDDIMPPSINPEIEMFRFFEMTPDLVCIANKEGYFLNINNAVTKTLGYTREELMSRPISAFQHPDDREATHITREQMLAGKALVNFDNRYIRKDGKIVWLNWTAIYNAEKQVVFAIAKDVTARKEAEQHTEGKYREFRNLANHFKASMEKDKKFLAVELHEQLAQLASAVKVDLTWLKEHASLDDEAQKRVKHATEMSQLLIDGIRRISYDISPGMIEDMGLNETLSWLCDEFSKHHGVKCVLSTKFDDARLSTELQVDLYRICQKLLKNALEHSRATNIQVLLSQKSKDIVALTVSDNGDPMVVEDLEAISGMSGIKERAASVNGELIIEENKYKGNTVVVQIPVKPSSTFN